MSAQGDLDIKISEWSAVKDLPSEDICKIPFVFSRTVDYLHPRTDSMINFMGPKNATANQIQFLYVPKTVESSRHLSVSELNVHRGIIMTLTQFQGIPMADVFKVLQYWTFEPTRNPTNGTLSKKSTTVRMALAIHYCKMTMLKSSILSGTKDEVAILVQKWCTFFSEKISALSSSQKKLIKASGEDSAVMIANDSVGVSGGSHRRSSRRHSSDLTAKPISDAALADLNRKIDAVISDQKSISKAVETCLAKIDFSGKILSALVVVLLLTILSVWFLYVKLMSAQKSIESFQRIIDDFNKSNK